MAESGAEAANDRPQEEPLRWRLLFALSPAYFVVAFLMVLEIVPRIAYRSWGAPVTVLVLVVIPLLQILALVGLRVHRPFAHGLAVGILSIGWVVLSMLLWGLTMGLLHGFGGDGAGLLLYAWLPLALAFVLIAVPMGALTWLFSLADNKIRGSVGGAGV